MKKRSVDILDSARDMELKLNWSLFKFEQDCRLFGNGTDGWKPGDPMHVNPSEMRILWFSADGNGEFEDEDCPFQFPREMLEEVDDAEILLDFYMDNLGHRFWLCVSCDVLWQSDIASKCWLCGRTPSRARSCYYLEAEEEHVEVRVTIAYEPTN